MKKRIIAMLIVLAMAVSLSAQIVTAATPATYDVGYAKVDINPYADGTGEDQTLLGLPMGGYAEVIDRLSVGKIDDNGDGKIDENDGLFATCIAVTDESGKTALLFNLDMLSAYTEFVTRVRDILLSDEAFAEFDLAADRILFNGSHSHSSPQMIASYASNKNFGEAYKAYRAFVVEQLVSAAKEALADRAPAKMYKGTIDASESEAKNGPVGDTLNENLTNAGSATQVAELTDEKYTSQREYNSVRHYQITEKEQKNTGWLWENWNDTDTAPIIYVAGNAFNGDYRGVGAHRDHESDSKKRYEVSEVAPVSEADDKMHILEFRFDDTSKESIVLINWRCHLPSTTDSAIASDAYYRVSSSMVNSLRYTLETEGYRAAYFQGAAGNVNSSSYMETGSWMRSDASGHSANRHNIYGTELAEVALELLGSNSMTQVNENGGEIKGLQNFYQTERKTVSVFEYLAGLQYKIAYYNNEGSGNRTYKDLYYYQDAEGKPLISTTVSVSDAGTKAKVTDTVTVDGTKTSFTPATGNVGLLYETTDTLATGTKITQSKAVVITSIFHANEMVDGYKANGTAGQEIELYALNIGDDFSLVAVSGEPFDRYSDNGDLTENKWDELDVDFVMGYTNNGSGYFGSKATFGFSEGLEAYGYAQGSYEPVRNPFVEGEGEKMLDELGSMLTVLDSENTATTKKAVCAHCQDEVVWTCLNQDDEELSLTRVIRSGHYYLGENITWDNKETMVGANICLDLNGKTLTVNHAIDVKSQSTLSIMGDGVVDGYEGKQYGGVFAIDNTATLNQYGGTIRYSGETTEWTEADKSPAIKYDGGILFVEGVFNMYGGKIEGSQVNWIGGAIYVDTEGVANFRGGEVTKYADGRPSYIGDCVANLGVVSLGGNANIAQIYMDYRPDGSPDLGEALVFDGEFTGYVNIHAKTAQLSVDIGNAVNNADFSRAEILVNSKTAYAPQIKGTDVYLTNEYKYVATDAVTGEVTLSNSFAVLEEAAAEGSTIALQYESVENITVSKKLYLELNGHAITGTVTVNEGVTLYVSDEATADFDITDNKYGTIKVSQESKGTVAGKPATGENDLFLKVDEGSDTYSFHAIDLNINFMNLKPESQGIYYKHEFVGDEKVAPQVVSYGVALSITGAPTEEDLIATKDLEAEECVVKGGKVVLTRFAGEFGSVAGTSTLVTGIMKETNGYTTNKRNSEKPIYGRAYARLADGTYVMGVTRDLSLRDLVEEFDQKWDGLPQNNRNSLLRSYKVNNYQKVMKYWTIPNIKNPTVTDKENEILRVLAVGNSHTVDATSMLAEIFAAEKPEQQVMVGALYKSGCKVFEHVNYAAENSQSYTYYKNEDGTWSPSLNLAPGTNTFKDALQDQPWDVVVLHEMNTTGILEATYKNSNLQTHINNINANSLAKPTLLWNLSWANPTGEAFLAQGDGVYSKWSSNYAAESNTDYATMFSQLVSNAQNYVMPNENISDMIPTGTAICYARNTMGLTDNDLYRDYTHMSDLGRLISGYVWYATITGQDSISDVKVNYIPKGLCKQNTSAGFTVTEEMKQIVIQAVNFALANPETVSYVTQ